MFKIIVQNSKLYERIGKDVLNKKDIARLYYSVYWQKVWIAADIYVTNLRKLAKLFKVFLSSSGLIDAKDKVEFKMYNTISFQPI